MNLGVLASGSGTNLQALLATIHGREADVVAVGSDRPGAQALRRARAAGVPAAVFRRADFASREARDEAMVAWLRARRVQLVVLAGYMQLVSPGFLAAFPRRVINVHPALLPAFPGLNAVEQALDYGAKVTGVTVHFVDEGVDTGPVILQRPLDIGAVTDPAELHARLHVIEHELLPEAVRLIAAGRVRPDPAHPRRILVE